MRTRKRVLPTAILLSLILVGSTNLPCLVYAAGSSDACTSQTNPFSVSSASWGTPGAPQAVYPGDQNMPLTVTFVFSGPCSSPQASFTLSLAQQSNPTPFTGQNGNPQPKDIGLNITPNSVLTETYFLNVDPRAATGVVYNIPLIIQYDNNTLSNVITEVTNVSIALYGPVQLNFAASTTRLLAGGLNNVTVTVSNTGSGASGSITTTVTPPQGVTLIGNFPKISSLAAQGTATELVQVFVPSSLSGTAVSLTFSANYVDAYSLKQTTTQSLGFVVYASVGSLGGSFAIQGAKWGTPAYPGGQNLLLTITAEYYGGSAATSVQGVLQLPKGFTDVYGSSQPSASTTSVASNSIFTLSYNLDVDSATALGKYSIPVAFTWTTAPGGSANTHVETDSLNLVLLGSVILTARTLQSAVTSGSVNSVQVVLSNLGSGSATQVLATAAGVGLSVLTQPPIVLSLPGNNSTTLRFTLYVPPSAANSVVTATLTASYTDAYGTPQSMTQTLAFYVSGLSSNLIEVTTLNGNVTEGQIARVSFLVKNTGTTAIASPTFALSLPPALVAYKNSSVTFQGLVIPPGQSIRYDALVTSTNTEVAGGVYTGSISISYTDSAGYFVSQTLPVSLVVSLPRNLVTMKQVSAQIPIGGSSRISFMITNNGETALYSPSFSISLPSPLALSANSTYAARAAINPGQSFVLYASVTDGPKTSEASYPGTLTLSYADEFGNTHSLSFPIGLVAVAQIVLVVQSEVVTQTNATSVSVSGTLLNEGQGPAYYTQVDALLSMGGSRLGNSSAYVGEVDPNTPVPFSITIPISAQTPKGTGMVTLSMAYQNDFGQGLALSNVPAASVSLDSAQLAAQGTAIERGTQQGNGLVLILEPALVLAVVVILLAALFLRRRRKKPGTKSGVI